MNNQQKIEELLISISKDDNKAFEELFYLTDKCVYSYILAIVGEKTFAEDIMQDTYIKIKNCAHLYQPCGKPLAWVFKIAKNLALMEIRRKKTIQLTDFTDSANEKILNNEICFNKDVEENILLCTALEQLNVEQREIVFLHAVSGFKHREIADMLNIPLGTILWRYNTSIKKLKKSYISIS